MEVVVYTRRECPLCDAGIAAAHTVFGEDHVRTIDVDLDLALLEKYTDRVPVIETVEGEIIAEGTISEPSLREFVE